MIVCFILYLDSSMKDLRTKTIPTYWALLLGVCFLCVSIYQTQKERQVDINPRQTECEETPWLTYHYFNNWDAVICQTLDIYYSWVVSWLTIYNVQMTSPIMDGMRWPVPTRRANNLCDLHYACQRQSDLFFK